MSSPLNLDHGPISDYTKHSVPYGVIPTLKESTWITRENRISQGHLYGIATLPNGKRVACGTCPVRLDDGSDWLDLYIPLGALGKAHPIGPYLFNEDEASCKGWQVPLDNWLVELGKLVFSVVPFKLGLIGWEVSGHTYAREILEKGIPEQRYVGYLWPHEGELEWHPPNTWPLMTVS